MKVLFVKDVRNVGQRDTVKDVSDGYALNFLIPQGLAVQATAAKLAEYEIKKKASEAVHAAKESQQSVLAQMLDGVKISVVSRINDAGHLYQQLSLRAVAEAIHSQLSLDIPESAISFENPIKEKGEHKAKARLGNAIADFSVVVEATK